MLSFPLCNVHAGRGGSYPQGIVRPIFRRMKIVISGIGEMGSHLAKMLSGHGHDITVIDSDSKALDELGSFVDLITVEGDTTAFAVLRRAGVATSLSP